MKSIFGSIAVILFFSLQSFAGPEEHIAVQTCYVQKNGSVPVANSVPERICLEEVSINQIDGKTPALNIYSYFHRHYFEGMTLTYFARHNENGYSFRAAKIILQSWDAGCGSAEKVVLKVNGRVDNNGQGDASFVDVAVEHETLNDTCHSNPQINTYEYTKEL